MRKSQFLLSASKVIENAFKFFDLKDPSPVRNLLSIFPLLNTLVSGVSLMVTQGAEVSALLDPAMSTKFLLLFAQLDQLD